MIRIKQIFLRLLKIIQKSEMRILPGNLAFFLVLSVIPIITLIGFTASLFSISIDSVINFMNESFPKEVSQLLIPFIDGRGFDINIGIFMLTGFIVASNGPNSIIVSSNTLYNINNSDYLKRRIKALFLTIILVLLFIFIVIVLAFGNTIIKTVLDIGILKNISQEFYYIYVLLKWPIAFILIYFTIKLVYTIAPDFNISSRFVTKGAIFTTIGWIFITAIYSYYVSNIANYDIFYGSLSNIIVMMMWIYFLAYILVLGIAINASQYDLEKNVTNNIEQ
jgi:membrane protein